MRIHRHCTVIWLFLTLLGFAFDPGRVFASDDSNSSPQLRKLVVLSRHGVRAPTQSAKTLDEWSVRPWARWPVPKGYLTPRGGLLVTAMWKNMRTHYANLGLLPQALCPEQGKILVRADVDQRTRETARALLDGLAPDCGLTYSAATGRIDPLFHPVKSGSYTFDPTITKAEIEGGLDAAQDKLASALRRVSELAAPPSAKFCAKYRLPPDCTVADAPSHIRLSQDRRGVGISGALGVGSDMAEIFLLEYAQWPDRPAAWGQVNQDVMAEVLPLHTQVFNMVNRAPVVAWARGTALLGAIAASLEGKHAERQYNEAAVVIFVGHDTNIANVGALLGVHWQPTGYPADSTTPAAALCFELWEHPAKIPGQKPAQEVRMAFYAQPLEVLHRPVLEHSASSEYAPEAAVMSGKAQFSLEDFAALVRKKSAGLVPQELGRVKQKGF